MLGVTSSMETNSSTVEDDSKSLWQYVIKIKKLSDGGGNFSWQCNFCHVIKKSSYTRVRAHLLKIVGQGIGSCLKVTPKDIADMQRLEDEAKTQMERKAPKNVLLPIASSSISFGKEPSFYLCLYLCRK